MAVGPDQKRGVAAQNNNNPELRCFQLEQEVSSLKTSQAELEYIVASTKLVVVKHKDSHRKLRIKHILLETDFDEQSRRLSAEMAKVEESQQRETRLRKKIDDLKETSKDSTSVVIALEKQVKEKDTRISSLEEKVEQLLAKFNAASEESKEAKNELKELKKELATARKESRSGEKDAESLSKQLQEKATEIKALQKELTAEKKNTATEKGANENIIKEMQKLQKELETKTSKFDEFKAKMDTVSKELQSTKSQLNLKKKKADEESESKIAALEESVRELKAELKEANKTNKTLTLELESSSKENDAITSLTKEKIALSRQLTTAQAENDALKAATENHRQILSEKLQLSHQVEQLQVELDNEKKAVKRASKSKTDVDDVKKSFEKQIAELKEQLNKQTKAADRATKELEKDRESWETQKGVLEKKIENWKTKAKAKEAAPAAKPKKRGATAFDDDVESPPKRTKKSTVAKSTFSTTPFLARHLSVAPSEASSTPSKNDTTANDSIAESPAPTFISEQITEVTETEPAADDVPPKAATVVAEAAKLMPPPPKPAPKPAKAKPAAPTKMFLSTTALKNAKPKAASIAPETSILGDDEVEYMPKSKKGKKKDINKENILPETIAEEPEEDAFDPFKVEAKKPKKVKMRKLTGNTLGNTLFDDDGEDGTFNKFRAPSVTGFNMDFSPLKQRGAKFEGVRKGLLIKRAGASAF